MVRVQPHCWCGSCTTGICISFGGTDIGQRPRVFGDDHVMQLVGVPGFVVMRQEETNPSIQDGRSFSLVNTCLPWGFDGLRPCPALQTHGMDLPYINICWALW